MLTPEQQQRYERQILFRALGMAGQERLHNSSVLVAGVGAIGCSAADMLVRGGVGHVRLVDHDKVDLSNLQRQFLYNEEDVRSGRPKAEIAAERLREVNSDVQVSAIVDRFCEANAMELLAGINLIIDAVDNFRTKFALNAAALQAGIPMMYGAVSGTFGVHMPVIPGRTGCLCCLYCAEPDPGSSETALTAGVLPAIVLSIAGLQATQAVKWLSGHEDEVVTGIIHYDVWDAEMTCLPAPVRADCVVCGGRTE